MATESKVKITVETFINSPVTKAWESWTTPEHITKWNHASDEWHAPWAKIELKPGGRFTTRMEAKDGSMGFDFIGVFDTIQPNEYLEYTLDDGRKVKVNFIEEGDHTKVIECFEAETENTIELQKGGWQEILNNFKKYTESI